MNNNSENNTSDMKGTILKNQTNKKPFAVPEGYFENLQQQLKEIPQNEQAKGVMRDRKVHFLFDKRLLAAASVIILLGIGYFFLNQEDAPSADEANTFTLILEEEPDMLMSLDENALIEVLASNADIDLDNFYGTGEYYDPFSDNELKNLMESEDISLELLYNL